MTIENLRSDDFAPFASALQGLRAGINTERKNVSDEDLVFVLRPYLWHVHQVAFKDVFQQSLAVLKILRAHRETLDRHSFAGVHAFLKGFVVDGNYDGREFAYVGGSLEMAAFVELGVMRKQLEKTGAPAEEIATLVGLEKRLQDMEGMHHVTSDILRTIGADHVDALLELTVTLAPVYQSCILHALDGFVGNAEVIGFYDRYLGKVEDPSLREEAERYRAAVAGTARN